MSLFKTLKLTWLSPEEIRRISHGQVLNHTMLDSRNLKQKIGGLFDPVIFGNSTSYECFCGRYVGKKHAGIKCESCRVLVADKNIQRWRIGRIEFACPVVNTLFFKNLASLIGKLLGVSASDLENIVHYHYYIVFDKGLSRSLKNREVLRKGVTSKLVVTLLEEITIINSEILAEEEREVTAEEKATATKAISKARQLLKTLNDISDESIFFMEEYMDTLEKYLKVRIITGAQALLELLQSLDIAQELKSLRSSKSPQHKVIRFCKNLLKNNLKLEWLVLRNIPVLAVGLRPVTRIKKEDVGGKEVLATAQINELYRKVLLANETANYYANSKEGVFFGEILINAAKRRLQKTVDNLFLGPQQKGNEIKGLMQQLGGKEGLFRSTLGKRTDYSARAVISVSPDLKFNEIEIPVEIALTVFRYLIIRNLLNKKIVFTVKEADFLIERELKDFSERQESIVIRELREICAERLILFVRAPTLHRLSMQVAVPKLVLGNVIFIHPLITTALNADADGDAMQIVGIVLDSEVEEVKECGMLSAEQIVDIKNGQVIAMPKQDIIVGLYYITKERKSENLKVFDSLNVIWQEYESQNLKVYDLFAIPASLLGRHLTTATNLFVLTTLGKIIFNEALPKSFPYFINDLGEYNQQEFDDTYQVTLLDSSQLSQAWKAYQAKDGWNKQEIVSFINRLVRQVSVKETADFLERLKEIGFDFSNQSGISISPFEVGTLITKQERAEIVEQGKKKEKELDEHYKNGFYSETEWKEEKIIAWTHCKEKLKEIMFRRFWEKKDTSFYQIWKSGARISNENLSQMFASRGRIVDYLGRIIDPSVISSFWEGLTPFEIFISSFGVLKGLMDKVLRTAETGYLSRRLTEAVQENLINSLDCGTQNSLLIKEEEDDSTPLVNRAFSHFLAEEVRDSHGRVILEKGVLLERKEILEMKRNKITSLRIYSPLTCDTPNSLCQKCYGGDLSKNHTPMKIGSAVGVIAAQSLGEPSTQNTLRTFHTGGVADKEDILVGLPKMLQIFDNTKPKVKAVIARAAGVITAVEEKVIKQKTEKDEEIAYPYDSSTRRALVYVGKQVAVGDKLTSGGIELSDFLNTAGLEECQRYILNSIRSVYTEQGIEIHDKHIMIFTRALLSRVELTNLGDADEEEFTIGDVVNLQKVNQINRALLLENKREIKFKPIVSSLKDLASFSKSFLSSAGFQSPLKTLINHSINDPIDYLESPKARLMVGQIPPIGKGFFELEKYKNMQQKRAEEDAENPVVEL